MTFGVVGTDEFIYFDSDLFFGKRIELSQVHIVLNDFQDEEQSSGDFVGDILNDDLIANDPKIAHESAFPQHTRFLPHTINEDT